MNAIVITESPGGINRANAPNEGVTEAARATGKEGGIGDPCRPDPRSTASVRDPETQNAIASRMETGMAVATEIETEEDVDQKIVARMSPTEADETETRVGAMTKTKLVVARNAWSGIEDPYPRRQILSP